MHFLFTKLHQQTIFYFSNFPIPQCEDLFVGLLIIGMFYHQNGLLQEAISQNLLQQKKIAFLNFKLTSLTHAYDHLYRLNGLNNDRFMLLTDHYLEGNFELAGNLDEETFLQFLTPVVPFF